MTFMGRARRPISSECPHMAHRDGRRFDGQLSLSGHCGHGPIFIAQRSVANDPKPNIRGAAIRSPTAMTSSTAVVTFQTRHAEPGHGFSGSFFVQRATAPFKLSV